jgi:hypothetical protein
VGQDVLVAAALEREAVRPVLAHADAVTKARAPDHVAHGGARRGHGAEQQGKSYEERAKHEVYNPFLGSR